MRIVFMGTPDFAVPILQYLSTGGGEVVAVYTQPDKTAGRGRALVGSAVKRAALETGLTVVQPASFKQPAAVADLAGFHPDLIVVAAYGQILPQAVLDVPPRGCVNVHGSLLPRFRGASPVAAAILAGDEFTGASIMLMDKGMDTGPVLARAQISISSRDTTGSLAGKLSQVSARFLMDVLPRWLKGEIAPQPQDESQASYSSLLTKQSGEIDWHLPAVELWRRVRALQPWPGCYTRWQSKQLKIIEAMPLQGDSDLEAGQVKSLDGGEPAFGVGAGDGVLGILKVQLEGKRPMPAAEFLRGQHDFIGAVLPS